MLRGLVVQDRDFDRFALMLVDNVVDLPLHRYAQDRAAKNKFWERKEEPEHDPKLVEKAFTYAYRREKMLSYFFESFDRKYQDSVPGMDAWRTHRLPNGGTVRIDWHLVQTIFYQFI